MPKFERLMKLARLTRESRVGTVREMSRACGVSQRTIYRYLNTLSEATVSEELRREAREVADRKLTDQLDQDDRCLICWVLDNNPAVDHPFFLRRLAHIKKLLTTDKESRRKPVRGQWFEILPGRSNPRPTGHDSRVTDFVSACMKGRRVRVRLRSKRGPALVLRPRNIRFSGREIQLQFLDSRNGAVQRFGLDDIASVRPCSDEAIVTTELNGARKKG